MSSTADWVSAAADLVAAIGTVGAVIFALFQDQIRRKLFPTSAAITQSDPEGEIAFLNNTEPILLFHLRLTNTSKHRELRACRLVVTEVDRLNEEGGWVSTILAVPQALHWAPQGEEPLAIDIAPEGSAIADFAYYRYGPGESGAEFMPLLRTMPSNFPGVIRGRGKVRYRIELRASNLDTPSRITLEADSLGAWNVMPLENLRGMISVRRLGGSVIQSDVK